MGKLDWFFRRPLSASKSEAPSADNAAPRNDDADLDADLRDRYPDPPRVQQPPEVTPPSTTQPTFQSERLNFGQEGTLPPGPLPNTMIIQLFMDRDGKYCSPEDVYCRWLAYRAALEDAKLRVAGTGITDDGNPFTTPLSFREYVEHAGLKAVARFYNSKKAEIIGATNPAITPSEAEQQSAQEALNKWVESVTVAQEKEGTTQETEQKVPATGKTDGASLQQIMEEIQRLQESVAALTPTSASEAAEQPAVPSKNATRPERP